MLKAIAFHLQAGSNSAKLPLSAFGAGWHEHDYESCAPHVTIISEHLTGRKECKCPHMLLWNKTLPLALFYLSTYCIFHGRWDVRTACLAHHLAGGICMSDGEWLCMHKWWGMTWHVCMMGSCSCFAFHAWAMGSSLHAWVMWSCFALYARVVGNGFACCDFLHWTAVGHCQEVYMQPVVQ